MAAGRPGRRLRELLPDERRRQGWERSTAPSTRLGCVPGRTNGCKWIPGAGFLDSAWPGHVLILQGRRWGAAPVRCRVVAGTGAAALLSTGARRAGLCAPACCPPGACIKVHASRQVLGSCHRPAAEARPAHRPGQAAGQGQQQPTRRRPTHTLWATPTIKVAGVLGHGSTGQPTHTIKKGASGGEAHAKTLLWRGGATPRRGWNGSCRHQWGATNNGVPGAGQLRHPAPRRGARTPRCVDTQQQAARAARLCWPGGRRSKRRNRGRPTLCKRNARGLCAPPVTPAPPGSQTQQHARRGSGALPRPGVLWRVKKRGAAGEPACGDSRPAQRQATAALLPPPPPGGTMGNMLSHHQMEKYRLQPPWARRPEGGAESWVL
jgi:hypothetical protein